MTNWHYAMNGEPKGPVNDDQLKALYEAGVINETTKVWQPAFTTWVTLADTDFKFNSPMAPPSIQASTYQTSPQPNTLQAQQYAPSNIMSNQQMEEHWRSEAHKYPENLTLFELAKRCVTTKYADFNGRAIRSEYWGFYLFYLLGVIGLIIVAIVLEGVTQGAGGISFFLYIVSAIALIVPSIAVAVRRLHDSDKSGWFLLIGLIPYLGAFIVLIFMILPSTPGANRYGPNPHGN